MRTVDFTSLPDDTVEGTEMLTAVLSNPSARAMIGPQGTAMINITDDAGNYPGSSTVNTCAPSTIFWSLTEYTCKSKGI